MIFVPKIDLSTHQCEHTASSDLYNLMSQYRSDDKSIKISTLFSYDVMKRHIPGGFMIINGMVAYTPYAQFEYEDVFSQSILNYSGLDGDYWVIKVPVMTLLKNYDDLGFIQWLYDLGFRWALLNVRSNDVKPEKWVELIITYHPLNAMGHYVSLQEIILSQGKCLYNTIRFYVDEYDSDDIKHLTDHELLELCVQRNESLLKQFKQHCESILDKQTLEHRKIILSFAEQEEHKWALYLRSDSLQKVYEKDPYLMAVLDHDDDWNCILLSSPIFPDMKTEVRNLSWKNFLVNFGCRNG